MGFVKQYDYAKENNKYTKNYNEDTILSNLMYLDANNLYGWAMSQKLPVNRLKWVQTLSRFNERFIKNCNESSDRNHYLIFMKIYHFYQKEKKLINAKNLFLV